MEWLVRPVGVDLADDGTAPELADGRTPRAGSESPKQPGEPVSGCRQLREQLASGLDSVS
jgi:hypothetical protein